MVPKKKRVSLAVGNLKVNDTKVINGKTYKVRKVNGRRRLVEYERKRRMPRPPKYFHLVPTNKPSKGKKV